ncbi:hypothetical protein B9Z55_024120 [Caenorhabditis nigoni]|nr:hypothetical protein B9Z55_024120 [Caenorhabditis nigoni]
MDPPNENEPNNPTTIFDLPDIIIQTIFLNLTFLERMSFSMVSRKAKQIMIDDPYKPLRLMFFRVDGSLELRVDDTSFAMSPYEMSDFPNKSLPGRRHIKVKRLENGEGTERTVTKYWDNPTGSFNNFIKLAQDVRGMETLNGIIFALRDLPCHIWKLHDILRPVKISEISFDKLTDKQDRLIYGVVRKIIEYILPNDSFCISFDPFKSVARNQTLHKKLQKQRKAWMSREFDRLILYNFPVTLEDVLNMRSRKVYCKSYWTKSMMRTFFEKWTNDGDSRLEWMQMENPRLFGPDKNIELLLSGLKYVKTKRTFNTENVHADQHFHVTKIGYDICQKDGTLASIFHMDRNKMEMYVWPETSVILSKTNPSRLLFKSLELHFIGESSLDQRNYHLTVRMDEATHFYFKCLFYVQRERIDGLKYVHTVKRGQDSLLGITNNIGRVFPSNELQIYQSRHEISPWGSYNEGQYEVSSKMMDEHDNVFVVYDWTLIVTPGTANVRPTTKKYEII